MNTHDFECRFDQWLAPLTIDEFRARHLGAAVLHLAQPTPALRALVDAAAAWSVSDLLARHQGDVVAWFHTRDGRHTSARVSPTAARELYEAGITLYLGGVPEVRRWTTQIAEALRLPPKSFFGAIFCNKPNADTRAHFDPVDIVCVQLRGSKRWWIAPNDQAPAPMQNWATLDPVNPELRLLTSDPMPTDIPDGAAAYDLTPGSLLYVPRGHWHKTFSAEESISLHVGYSTITYVDLVLHALRATLTRDPAFRAAPYAFWDERTRELEVARLRALLRRAASAVRAIDAEDLVPAERPSDPVDRATRFARSALATLGIDGAARDGDVPVSVNAHTYPTTRVTRLELASEVVDAALAIARMPAGERVSPDDGRLARFGLSDDEAAELLALLEGAGLVRRSAGHDDAAAESRAG